MNASTRVLRNQRFPSQVDFLENDQPRYLVNKSIMSIVCDLICLMKKYLVTNGRHWAIPFMGEWKARVFLIDKTNQEM